MAAEKAAQPTYSGIQSTSVYEAHPLNVSDSTNIRLLSFVPTSPLDDSATIQLNIGVFPFNHSPPYTALSYVWGQDSPSRDILLDKHLVKVRTNLWDFLDRARHDDSIKYLWIDALCIDQSSIPERNHQVAIMGPIYRRAEMAVVWLGASPPNLVQAVRRLAQIDWTPAMKIMCKDDDVKPRLVLDLNTLSQAEYWRRMWTLQEYVLASKISLWCGQYESITSKILDMYESIDDERRDLILNDGIRKMGKYHWLRYKRQNPSGTLRSDFDEVFESNYTHPGQCSDSKDRIYSILSLAIDEDFTSDPIDVDYGQTTSDLFFSLVNRRFRQLDGGNQLFPPRLSCLSFFTSHLAEYLEIEGDQEAALTESELHKLWMQEKSYHQTNREKDMGRAARWRQAGKLISNRGGVIGMSL